MNGSSSPHERKRAGDVLRGVAGAAERQRGVRGRAGEESRELVHVAGLVQQRGGAVDAPAQLGDRGCNTRLHVGDPRDQPVVVRRHCPVKRGVCKRLGDIEAAEKGLLVGAQLEDLRDAEGIPERARDSLRLGHGRVLLGSPLERHQDHPLDA